MQILRARQRAMSATGCIGKTATGTGMAIDIRQIGLDVVNGSTVHKVGTEHVHNRSARRIDVYALYSDRRKCQTVRTIGRPSGKDAHLHVAAKQRRTCRDVMCIRIFGEAPDKPQIIKPFHTAHRIGIAERRFKHYPSAKIFHNTALTWYSELGGERRTKEGNRLYHLFHDAKIREISEKRNEEKGCFTGHNDILSFQTDNLSAQNKRHVF